MSPGGRGAGKSAAVPWRAVGLVAAVAAVTTAAVLARADLQAGLLHLEHLAREAGWAAPALYVAAYVAWTIAGLPGSLITVAGGSLFAHSPAVAVAAVSAGSTLGAAACFLVARHLARDQVMAWVGDSGWLATLDRATERQGVWLVAIVRLTPIVPFNVANYAFGLTRVGFWPYLATSWLCMLPGTLVYVVGASAVTRALRDGRVPWPLVAALGAALAVAASAGLLARRRWRCAREAARSGPARSDEGA